MHYQSLSNIHIVCTPLPHGNTTMANARNMQRLTLPISTLPISWYGTLADFDNMPQNTGTVCLELDSDDLCVKHRLRMKLRSARNSFPAMKAVVISKPNQDSHYDLLIDEGISVILTQSTNSTLSASLRRPTPTGWPCRNVQWGLWEVARANPKQRLFARGFFTSFLYERPHDGTLRVLDTGSKNGTYDHKKFMKATRRLQNLISKKMTTVIGLDQLPTFLSKSSSRERTASILKAA